MKMPASVLSPSAHPTLSERYTFINTSDIVARMEKAGFYVAAASASNPRSRDPLFGKHLVDFRIKDAERFSGTEPRVLFLNSHDGTHAARVMVGLYRFVCANGLVVGQTLAAAQQRHTGDAAAEIIQRMQEAARRAVQTNKVIDAWTKIECADKDVELFATLSAQLRWGNANLYDPQEIARPRRKADERNDFWTVFNRVQENTVRGGLTGFAASGRAALSRPITDITRDTTYNAQLWQLGEEFADHLLSAEA